MKFSILKNFNKKTVENKGLEFYIKCSIANSTTLQPTTSSITTFEQRLAKISTKLESVNLVLQVNPFPEISAPRADGL